MDTKAILHFLRGINENNNREWFLNHKDEYLYAKESFKDGVAKAIARICQFDASIAHLTPKDCTYRFYRDVRFSKDKSPYKRHLGAYISGHGKKGLHGGYYIHVQPGNCLIAFGAYWLPTNILTSCRNEIMGNHEAWLQAVENEKFIETFGLPNATEWSDDQAAPKGFGISCLKTVPKGFPKDYPHMSYLRMKDYCCWTKVSDQFFEGDEWLEAFAEKCQTALPMMQFINDVIDDYE